MGIGNTARARLTQAGQSALNTIFKYAKRLPIVRERIEKEYEKVLGELRSQARPYGDEFERYSQLPDVGRPRPDVLKEMETLRDREESRWRDGFVSGAVYHGDAKHIEFLSRVYALNSQTNPLHSDLWPRIAKYEAEIVAMTGHMLGASQTEDEVCGVVSSGGTESILLAMKAYRDRARDLRGITAPEMVVPVTAHAAFDKASQYFNIKQVKIPVGADFRADVRAAKRAIGRNTVVVVGSAPSFPHGTIDPIEQLSELAHKRRVGFHTDACLGGFMLPWAERLGYAVPPFDFRLRGVTSMSADTHKYGYAAKGTSVVLYRGRQLRHYQYYKATDWPGGLYFSPTFAGSRPGALSAACWASMVSTGERGYLDASKRILETATRIRDGIDAMDTLQVLGDPLWVIAFAAKDPKNLDIYRVMDFMTKRRWNLNGLHRPPCVHLCVTLRHTQAGVAERFTADLRDAVSHVQANPDEKGGMAPVYGLAATLPVRGAVADLLQAYLDVLYEA